TRSIVRKQALRERYARLDGLRRARALVLDDVVALAVLHALEADVRLPEERRKALEVRLFPVRERVVMALGTIKPQSEERARDAAREAHRVWLVLLVLLGRDAHEIGRGVVGPQTISGDEFADDRVVALVGGELVGEPGHEAATAVEQEGPLLGAHERAGHA